MKLPYKILLPFVIFLISNSVCAQAPAGEQEIFTIVEQMPEYPGGMKAYNAKLAERAIVPEVCQKYDSTFACKIFVRFVVTAEGKTINHVVLKSCAGCAEADNLALDLLKKDKTYWVPGRQNGRPVAVFYSMPILFKATGRN